MEERRAATGATNPATGLGFGLRAPRRLSQALMHAREPLFSRFAVIPTNVLAVEAALQFSVTDPKFVILKGPSGWGKSHLLRAAAENCERKTGQPVPVPETLTWLTVATKSDATPLILDNAQVAFANPRARQDLKLALERAVTRDRPILLAYTLESGHRDWTSALPSVRKWLSVALTAPAAPERALILRRMSQNEEITLSDRLIRILSHRIGGSGASLLGAVQRLKLERRDWLGEESDLAALGLLEPFLNEESGWDLRDHVHEAVGQTGLDVPTYSVAILRQCCRLPEQRVATYYGLSSSQVFSLANRTLDPVTYAQCVRAVTEALDPG